MTHRKQVLATDALLQLCDSLVLPTYPAAKLLEDASLLCLPVPLLAILQDAVELLLSLLPRFFNGRDEILFVRMAEVPCHVGVLQSLQRGERGGRVQVRNLASQRGSIDACLGKEIIPERFPRQSIGCRRR